MTTAVDTATRARELRASGGLVFTAFLWGSMIAFTGHLLTALDPMVIAAGRYAIAAPIVLLMAWRRERGVVAPVPLPLWRTFLLGAVGMTGFAACYSYGILWSDPITAAAIIAMTPVVSLIMQRLMVGVRTPWRLAPGIVMATLGAVGVGLSRPHAAAGEMHGGEFLLILGAAMWTWYSLRAQSWLADKGISQLRLSGATMAAGAIGLVVVLGLGVMLGVNHLPTTVPEPLILGQMLWIGVLSTALAIPIWNAGVSVLGVGVASLFANLTPVLAVAMSVALGAEPSLGQLIGGLVVIAGVVWVQVARLRP